MYKRDFIALFCVLLFFAPFFLFDGVFDVYKSFNKEHGVIMSMVKFGILATFGEVIGLRIKKGVYYEKGWGLLPRIVVWALLGIIVKIGFVVYATGIPEFVKYMGIANAVEAYHADALTWEKIVVAFSISAGLNLIFGPFFMTLHKVSDSHILNNGGGMNVFLKKMDISRILQEIDWSVQWHFVFKKTIPMFWIPVHTVVFVLPDDYRILSAALLGVVLGVIMAVASLKGSDRKNEV